MESRADRRTSHALHTVTTHDHASDRPGYFIGELRLTRASGVNTRSNPSKSRESMQVAYLVMRSCRSQRSDSSTSVRLMLPTLT